MSKLFVYDPAMCCPSGMCGVSIDEETIRIATVLHAFKKHGVEVKRYNLTSNPMEFITQSRVNKAINEQGVDCLPIIVLNDEIVLSGRYPTNQELCHWVGLNEDVIPKREKKILSNQQGVNT
jgi:hypothetical protein